MAIHYIREIDAETMTGNYVSGGHFGANLVTTTGTEFVDPQTPEYAEMIVQAGITSLRYPGGSVTEQHVDMNNPNLSQSAGSVDHPSTQITPMNQFFARSGEVGLDVNLVIPTSSAFHYSAGEAAERIVHGESAETYGNRTVLRDDYLDEVKSYVRAAMDESISSGASINSFEIGNEFWGGAVKMTASEYGIVAGNVAVAIREAISEAISTDAAYSQFADTEVIIQMTRSANEWSPRYDTQCFVQYIDGEPYAREQSDYNAAIREDDFDASDWVSFTIPGQGRTTGRQADLIADGISSVPGAVDAIDGVLFHYYISGGVASVNDEQSTIFHELMSGFEGRLNLPAGTLSQHVTEWNPRANGLDTSGLAQASMISEMFYEMVRNGIDCAQIWPLSFDTTASRTIIDEDAGRLTVAGEMFRLMGETLVDTTPVFDFVVENQFAAHGYGATDGLSIFVSDRDGEASHETLVVANFIDLTSTYFLVITELWDGGTDGQQSSAVPVLNYFDGYMAGGSSIHFTMQSWANVRIEITYVTSGNDYIEGRGGNDSIVGSGGHDTILGGDGDDSLNGGSGNDVLSDGLGNDRLTGASGSDTFILCYDGMNDVLIDFDPRVDRLDLSAWPSTDDLNNLSIVQLPEGVRISYLGETLDLLGTNASIMNPDAVRSAIISGPSWSGPVIGNGNDGSGETDPADESEALSGSSGSDLLVGTDLPSLLIGYQGDDTVVGGDSNDTLVGGMHDDSIRGGDGDDSVRGGYGQDTIFGEGGSDNIQGGNGDDSIIGGGGENRLFGQRGEDTLYGGSQNDILNGGGGSDLAIGGRGNDWFRAGNGNDTLFGGQGRDTIFGNSEGDQIDGGADNDRIFGGGGSDTIIGGEGDDFIKGGEGADTFIFERGMGADDLLGFDRTEDVLRISRDLLDGQTTGAQVLADFGSVEGRHVVFDFGQGDSITLLWANSFDNLADDLVIF